MGNTELTLATEVVRAWIACERNKKRSCSAIKFRWHVARDLQALWRQIKERKYVPHSSMVFMVTKPVRREVWAGAMRDRVVHHYEYERFSPVLEEFFVEVGDASMNCRKGYGSLRAILTLNYMIQRYTEGYKRDDCWIVSGDFANFFMSIDKAILWREFGALMEARYHGEDKELLMYLMRVTLTHRCQDNYFRKSPLSMWDGFPERKSLLHQDGLPIGNLPSQNWANFMGALFTRWIMQELGYKYFIIFVDDFKVLVRSAEEGRELIKRIREYLRDELHITLHPNKVQIQHYSKGTAFVGSVLKPGRRYVSNRTRGAFITKMIKYNRQATSHGKCMSMLRSVRATINSYLGAMAHHDSYNVRRRIAQQWVLPVWVKYLYFDKDFKRCVIRHEYDERKLLAKRLHNAKFARRYLRCKR